MMLGAGQPTTTQTVQYRETLAEMREKYTHKANEAETEHAWRVSLTGGGWILLSEAKARGSCGEVWLPMTDN